MHRTPVKDLHFAQIRVTENVESTMIKQSDFNPDDHEICDRKSTAKR